MKQEFIPGSASFSVVFDNIQFLSHARKETKDQKAQFHIMTLVGGTKHRVHAPEGIYLLLIMPTLC